MKIVYFDLIGGASGNMILSALLDAGLPEEALRASLEALHLPGLSLDAQRVTRRGIAGTLVEVVAEEDETERRLGDLISMVEASNLDTEIRQTSIRILTRMGQVESYIHSQSLSEVHLHELGGVDTLVDIVGAVSGLRALEVDRVLVSPFPLARGQIQTDHGRFPLPAPATVALLHDAPVVGVAGERETVTPTAAAILTTLAQGYGELPRMMLRSAGYGAGSRDDETPNVLRLFVGEDTTAPAAAVEAIMELQTNIDDMNPQMFDYLIERLFTTGALDVTLTPLLMKKTRPGTRLEVLSPVTRADELRGIILNETTTLGVREQIVSRYVLPREIIAVETSFGTLRAKIAQRPDGRSTVFPEYDDCVRAAREQKIPLQSVMEAVKTRAEQALAIRSGK